MLNIGDIEPPIVRQLNRIRIPGYYTIISDSGVPIYYIKSNIPVIKISYVNIIQPDYKSLCSNYVTSKMLLEGTVDHTYVQISDIIDFYGACLSTSSYASYNCISLLVLRKFFDKTFNLLNEIVDSSTFEEDRLEHIKTLDVEQLHVEQTENKIIATKLFKEKLFGANNPYGWYRDEQSINNTSRMDLLNAHGLYWRGNCSVFACGTIDDNIIDQINSHMSRKLGHNDMGYENVYSFNNKEQSMYVEKPDSTQTSVRIGKFLIPMMHDDYKKLWCTIAFLGGYFGSRLMKNIREKNGYTYGIGASLIPNNYISYVIIKSSVKKEYRDTVREEIIKEINRLKHDNIDDKELYGFKQFFMGNMYSQMSDPINVMSQYKILKIFGIPDSYYKSLFNTIMNISKEDIRDMATKYLSCNDLTTVMVG